MSLIPPPPHPRSWRPPPPEGADVDANVELSAEDLVPEESAAETPSDLYDFGEDDIETTPYQSDYPSPDLRAQQPSWPVIQPALTNYSSWPPTVVDTQAADAHTPVYAEPADFGDRLSAFGRVLLEQTRTWLLRASWQVRSLGAKWVAMVGEHWDRVGDREKGWLRSRAPYVLGLLVVATSMFSIGRTMESSAEAPPSSESGLAAALGEGSSSPPSTARIEHGQDGASGEISLPAMPGVSPSPDKEAPILVGLAENLLAARRDAEAVPVLERALARNAKLTDDPDFLRVVKRAALSEDRMAAAQTYALLVGPMGERGAEILYEISVSADSRRGVRERAAYFVYTKDFERKAPLPLYAAFKLVSASTCEAKKSLLPFAAEAGGRHALAYLKELDARKVCTLEDLDNCYSCMNADEELPRTIAEIEARLGSSPP